MIKTKKQYFEEVKAHFDKEWAEFRLNLKSDVDGVKFRDVVGLIEKINGDSQFQFNYWELFHEAGILETNVQGDFFVPSDSDNLVREYNRLHENLEWAFCCEGSAYLVKATVQADMAPFIKYFVSTEKLYCMGNPEIERMILRRMGNMNMEVLGAKCRSIDMQEYMLLLETIVDKKSYEKKNGTVLMKGDAYDAIFDSLDKRTAVEF